MMSESISEDLYDYADTRGRLQILLHRSRWRWLVAGIIALSFTIPFVIAHIVTPEDDVLPANSPAPLFMASDAQQQQTQTHSLLSKSMGKGSGKRNGNRPEPPPPPSSSAEGNGNVSEYNFNGATSTGLLSNFADFAEIVAFCLRGSNSISLSNVYLDAAQFSLSLETCSQLESVSLENVSLIGNLTRVYLPKLTKFVYVQNPDDKRDSYKSPETLQQTLFFDLHPDASPSWNVEQDLLNLGIDITICKGGTRLIDIRHSIREVYLNIKYCEPVILSAKNAYDSLTLINCNVTEAGVVVIPSTLKYLNVRNAIQRTPQLAQLVRRLTKLEELYVWLTFHCDWPGYELFLNLNDLPQTIKTVGINNVDTTYLPGAGASTSLKTLTVGDYTTNSTISQGFPKLFPNLERVNVVNMSDPSPAAGYSLIYTAIQMQVKEIAVVNLHRNYSTAIENQPEILSVETVLDHAGIPKELLSCFILVLENTHNGTVKYSGRKLTTEEQHQIRWNGLGFNKMDSWEDYLKWDAL